MGVGSNGGDDRLWRAAQLTNRLSELQNMQDRLLHAYLAGTIDEATLRAKIRRPEV